MATTGAKFAGAGASSSVAPYDDAAWGNPGRIVADDTSYADCTSSAFDLDLYSHILKGYTFDFSSIPAGATIDGVIVTVRMWTIGTTPTSDFAMVQLLDTSAAITGTNLGTGTTTNSEATYTFGGATNKWGCALTRDWVQNSNFGVGIAMQANGNDADLLCDWVQMEVYYTEAASGMTNQVCIIFES